MEFFNFVETFFFVSLVITFVLIMMLVYHFKERITILEKKTNTMFDIVTNIVTELNIMRNYSDQNINQLSHIISKTSEVPLSNIFSQLPQKIVVSEDEDDEEEHDEDDDEYDEDDEDEVKVINIDLMNGTIENIIPFEELNESVSSSDEDEDLYNSVTDFESYTNNEQEKELDEVPNLSSEIKVEKSNNTTNEDSNSYRKMDINSLRNLVAERGINADIKKLKKIELIRLLDPTA